MVKPTSFFTLGGMSFKSDKGEQRYPISRGFMIEGIACVNSWFKKYIAEYGGSEIIPTECMSAIMFMHPQRPKELMIYIIDQEGKIGYIKSINKRPWCEVFARQRVRFLPDVSLVFYGDKTYSLPGAKDYIFECLRDDQKGKVLKFLSD